MGFSPSTSATSAAMTSPMFLDTLRQLKLILRFLVCSIQCTVNRTCRCFGAFDGTISDVLNTLRTGDADLRFYITTVQDG